MYDRVLLPVDGSDEARRAAQLGLELARRFDADAIALHVVEQSALQLTRSSQEERRVQARGEEILADVEELAASVDHPVATEVAEGNPVVQICERATALEADLIVLGRQGLTGLGRRLLGGVTEQVLAQSDCPVLVVPAGDGPTTASVEYDRLLVPTDGSENAERATTHAVPLADRYDTAVHVLTVIDLQAAGGVFNAGGLEQEFVDRLEAAGSEAVERLAAEVRDELPDLPVETAVDRTNSFEGAAAGIRAYVVDHDIDLVVMSSHGRSNVARQVLGSVTSTVLRTVAVPVLVTTRAG